MGRVFTLLMLMTALLGCQRQASAPPAPPPPQVSVIKLVPSTVTVYEEYAGQTEAVDAVELRPRVGGILERQAYVDGADVKKGDLLFVIDPRPYRVALAQARANLAQAEASLTNSQQNLARAKPLFGDAAISRQEYDAAIAKAANDTAAVESFRAQIREAQLNLDYTTIRAPRDGAVSKALIRPGGLVKESDTLLTTLYSVDPMHVSFVVPEQKLAELRDRLDRAQADDSAIFRIKLVDGNDYPYPGTLDFVDAAVDPRNGTLQVRISVPNPDRALRPGQFVRVIVPAREIENAIRVPQRAVTELLGQQSVYVVGADNKAEPRQIIARTRIGNDWLVEQGLAPDERIIVEGAGKVRPDAPVKPVEQSPPAESQQSGSQPSSRTQNK